MRTASVFLSSIFFVENCNRRQGDIKLRCVSTDSMCHAQATKTDILFMNRNNNNNKIWYFLSFDNLSSVGLQCEINFLFGVF